MKKIPYCNQCKYYGGKGVCNHPEHGGKYPHIKHEFLERLEADPFDPDIIAMFDEKAAQSARNAAAEPGERA